jgi:hypothetical protein
MDEMQKLLYEELGRTWQHFVSWREKIFAGYLAVQAALGVAYSHSQDSHYSDDVSIVILFGAVLFSIVFWILDVRTNQLVNACQHRAASLEEDHQGAYHAIKSVGGSCLTYSLAVDVLVSSVASLATAYIVPCLVTSQNSRMSRGSAYLVTGWHLGCLVVVLILLLQLVRRTRPYEERKKTGAPPPKAKLPSAPG